MHKIMEKKPYETPEIQVFELEDHPPLLMQSPPSNPYGGNGDGEGWMN